jgi:2-keto-3-deoxy-L-rhamnonate aldolase RhmA
VQPAVIAAFLDAGVHGILAPHVDSVEQARTLVAASRVDQNTFTAALIESVRGIEALESIMAVAGLDCVAIGPNDLGRSLGVQTGMADPQVRARVREAEIRIESYGKPRLTVVTDAEQARAARACGARLIAVSDAALVRTAGCLFLETAT